MTTAPPGPPADQGAAGDAASEAEFVRTAVLSCAGVVRLSAGRFGDVTSYRPGRATVSIPGVRLTETSIEVTIVAGYGQTLTTVTERIEAAVASVRRGRSLDVVVDDIEVAQPAALEGAAP